MVRKVTYNKAICEAVDEEMARDPKVYILGEEMRAWGSARGEFAGLHSKWGDDRVMDTPISEMAILGSSIGAAILGFRPIAVIMFSDFLGCCGDELLNQLSLLRYMSGGKIKLPVTVMSYIGAGAGAAAQHSKSPLGMLMGIVGLKIIVPSNPYDAKGLIKSAIREDNPTICIYHHGLMVIRMAGEIPEEEYTVPLGRANLVREGSDVTVLAISYMVDRAIAAAETLGREGISVEVIDPRTLVPLDEETIFESVRKTGRLIIMDEEPINCSAACHISAIAAEKAFQYLKAPIKRVCAPDTPIPFSPTLEKYWMPDEGNLIKAIHDTFES